VDSLDSDGGSVKLRPELMPPAVDEAKVAQLARLAARIDGAHPGQWEDELAEFNRLAGTVLTFYDFQGIYGAEEHDVWVRRVLVKLAIHPVADVTRAELIEIVRRAMSQNGYADYEGYMAVFDANVPMPDASNLIFYPPDYNPSTNSWGGGRQMGQYDPTPEQVVDWALSGSRKQW
jgi:hypothetical protein